LRPHFREHGDEPDEPDEPAARLRPAALPQTAERLVSSVPLW